MNFLAIDTTMQQLSLAISFNGKEKTRVVDIPAKKHNSTLLTQIDKLLKDIGCTLQDMDIFGVVTGPGSFTGIRIGIAVINAFCFALNKKVVEITALELASYNYKHTDIMAMIDCRNNNFYAGIFKNANVKYLAVTGEQAKSYNLKQVLYESPDAKALLEIMKERVSDSNHHSIKAQPFYMKKSSAEIQNEQQK